MVSFTHFALWRIACADWPTGKSLGVLRGRPALLCARPSCTPQSDRALEMLVLDTGGLAFVEIELSVASSVSSACCISFKNFREMSIGEGPVFARYL